jgi:hypothetical protein
MRFMRARSLRCARGCSSVQQCSALYRRFQAPATTVSAVCQAGLALFRGCGLTIRSSGLPMSVCAKIVRRRRQPLNSSVRPRNITQGYFMLERIKHGFFLGLGFTIAMLGLSIAGSYFAGRLFSPERKEETVRLSDLHVEQSEIVQRENKLVILGSITNNGERKWHGVTLRAELFGNEKKFLDQCELNDRAKYDPKETKHFKIVCSSCKDISLSDISSHTVAVIEAY